MNYLVAVGFVITVVGVAVTRIAQDPSTAYLGMSTTAIGVLTLVGSAITAVLR